MRTSGGLGRWLERACVGNGQEQKWEMRGFVEKSFEEIGGNLGRDGGERVVAAG